MSRRSLTHTGRLDPLESAENGQLTAMLYRVDDFGFFTVPVKTLTPKVKAALSVGSAEVEAYTVGKWIKVRLKD